MNLTDGLDGLAIGPVMTVGVLLLGLHLRRRQIKFATYLDVPHIAGAGEVAIFCAALIASSMGFLWYNAYPASMMMGDVGALSLGGAHRHGRGAGEAGNGAADRGRHIRARGGLGHHAALLLQDDASSGFFRMAPLHHHFELGGWPETVVVMRFWIISIVCALVALSTLKLR